MSRERSRSPPSGWNPDVDNQLVTELDYMIARGTEEAATIQRWLLLVRARDGILMAMRKNPTTEGMWKQIVDIVQSVEEEIAMHPEQYRPILPSLAMGQSPQQRSSE